MLEEDNIDNKYYIITRIRRNLDSRHFLVKNVNNKKEYEAKINNNLNQNAQEVQMLINVKTLNNPYIINMESHGNGTIKRGGNIINNQNYIILEYTNKKDLFEYVYNGGNFSEKHAKYIFDKIVKGVKALHEAKICHRNLNLNNISLSPNFTPKINDFSFATFFQENNGNSIILNDFLGTISYMAPQMHKQLPYKGDKADIFSLGIILFNLVTGKFGFLRATDNDHYYSYIIKGKIDEYWNKLPHEIKNIKYSDDFKNLYIQMVDYNEDNRPTTQEILQHHWFDEIRNLNKEQLAQLDNEVQTEFHVKEM